MPDHAAQQTDVRHESELEARRWAVISFERREASGLTYSEAVATVADLEGRNVAGICLVTDEAAARVNP